MPSGTGVGQMLRDDLLAQLRSSTSPLTTRRLRHAASLIPAPGFKGHWQPLREQVYRALRHMQHDGLVEQLATCGREVAWKLTDKGAARQEIEYLTTLFTLPQVPDSRRIPSAHQRINRPKENQ